MYFVYLLESLQDKSWYIGYTPNSPDIRLEKHNASLVYYTKRKVPWRIIYYEAYLERSDALGREKFLKSGAGRKFLTRQLTNYLSKKGSPRASETSIRGPIV